MPLFPPRLVLLLGLAALLPPAVGLTGCTASRPAPPPTEPDAPALVIGEIGRPSDGLFERDTLQALVEAQSRRDAETLAAALRADDPAVRARAAFALGSVQDAEAVPALRPLLHDPEPRVRADAAFALGQSADSTVAPALLEALGREEDPAVQALLVEALGKTGGRTSLTALAATRLPDRLDAVRALAFARYGLRDRHHPAAVDWLAEHLTVPDSLVRLHAAYYFGRMRDPQPWLHVADRVAAASESLSADDPAQMHLALALGRLPNKPIETRRLRLLRESADWRVRTNAARALAGSPTVPAQEALLAALDDPSPHVAQTAASALAGADSPAPATVDAAAKWLADHAADWRTGTALLPLLVAHGREAAALAWTDALDAQVPPEWERPFARAAALGALGAAGSPEAMERLVDAAAAADSRVAYAALEALKTRWARERSAEAAPTYFGVFAEALRRRDLATAYAAAPALTDSLFVPLGTAAVLRETYAAMTVPDEIESMVAVVRAVGAVPDTAAVTFLLGVTLEGPHPTIREAAAEALTTRFSEGIVVEPTGLQPPAFPALDWAALRRLGPHPRLALETDRGTVVLELDAEEAPLTVQQITRYATEGRYDGVPFHRVVPNFVVQGGDYTRADGFGGPGSFLPSELTRLGYAAGTLGMASAGKDTEGSQFFVTHSMQPHLDGRYTAFGRVVAGQDVVDALFVGDRVLRARVE
ncbi:MAG: HEAT repeat domain-containing protein [Rhodothermales bacterium]|nr:HEAT repeat domain-containing protein [Rhodothermales bacterium]